MGRLLFIHTKSSLRECRDIRNIDNYKLAVVKFEKVYYCYSPGGMPGDRMSGRSSAKQFFFGPAKRLPIYTSTI